jgi:prepilin-type N-terminal cleavage/methylation domain-containing protein
MKRAGFTIVELLLALALFAILALAILRLFETATTIWRRTESSRDLAEVSSATLDLVARDLSALEGGPRGDVWCDWARFDANGDGLQDLVLPRLRFVRQVSAAERARSGAASPGAALGNVGGRGLVEVCWALVPAPRASLGEADARGLGLLLRGERALDDEERLSFFDARFFDSSGRPAPGALDLVGGGCLWFGLAFAGPTSVVREEWRLGTGLADATTSWDAFGRGRADAELTPLNAPYAGPLGDARASGEPALPRRVRVELEIERPGDLKRRTRLAIAIDPSATAIEVQDGTRLPAPGSFVRIDDEWLELGAPAGSVAPVQRGQRGTRAGVHVAGALLHHGSRQVREVPVPTYREDWKP